MNFYSVVYFHAEKIEISGLKTSEKFWSFVFSNIRAQNELEAVIKTSERLGEILKSFPSFVVGKIKIKEEKK